MYEKQTKISRNELQKRFKYVFITYDIYTETLRSTSLISTPLSLTLVYLSRIKSFKDCNINFHSFFYSFFFYPSTTSWFKESDISIINRQQQQHQQHRLFTSYQCNTTTPRNTHPTTEVEQFGQLRSRWIHHG